MRFTAAWNIWTVTADLRSAPGRRKRAVSGGRCDNGLGMTEEQVGSLPLYRYGARVASKRGSGIGVRNVNELIGCISARNGLSIESEPDEGTGGEDSSSGSAHEKVLEEKKV